MKSASEKLRALDAATKDLLPTLNYYIGPGARTAVSHESVQMYYATKAVRNALPFIADCIEAAEEVSVVEATGTLPDFQPLADALTALREHLEGGDES